MTDTIDTEVDIRTLLAKRHLIAVIWCVEDVQQIRPDLTEDQCWEVLQTADRRHNAEFGISWSTFEDVADELFGEATGQSEDDE